jgi:hypothetical protein
VTRFAGIVAVGVACGCGRIAFEPVDGAADAASCEGVDLQTDGENCGVCGHDCLGGDCEAGVCQAVMIAGGQGAGRSIVDDDTHVYWAAQQAIRRADKLTRTVETVATFSGTAFRMTEVDGYVYWVTRNTGLVARAAMAANADTEIIATGQGDVGGIASDGTNVYWNNWPVGGHIYAGTIEGVTPTEVLTTPTDGLTGMRLIGSTLYYIELGVGLRSIPVTGGAPAMVVPDVGSWEFEIDGDDVFLADGDPGGRLLRASLNGVAPADLGPVGEPWGFAVDATHVYCANEGGDTITRIPRGGGTPEILATSPAPVGIVVDDHAVYWTTYAGDVFLVAK